MPKKEEGEKVVEIPLPPPQQQRALSIVYTKAGFFRVVHADGVLGGGTPTGELNIALWSQRYSYPERIQFEYNPDGTLSSAASAIQVEAGADLTREVEVGVIMTPPTALALIEFLEQTLEGMGIKRRTGEPK
jgi:hypothetical protein